MLGIASALALLANATAGCAQSAEKAMTEDGLRTEVTTRLPKGTAASDVEAWLSSKGLEHSGLIDNATLAHMGADARTFELKAIARSAPGAALVRTDTQLSFTFDRDHRLIEARVTPVHTGL